MSANSYRLSHANGLLEQNREVWKASHTKRHKIIDANRRRYFLPPVTKQLDCLRSTSADWLDLSHL